MSTNNHSPFIDILEHEDTTAPETKRVLMYGWDPVNLRKVRIGANSDGTFIGGIGLPSYDYVLQSQASTTDTWTFKTGGAGGTTVSTITITYTDNSKETILNVAKT